MMSYTLVGIRLTDKTARCYRARCRFESYVPSQFLRSRRVAANRTPLSRETIVGSNPIDSASFRSTIFGNSTEGKLRADRLASAIGGHRIYVATES